MAHDIFISHSTKDKAVADAVCAAVEHASVRCWIAPRDVLPGADWSASIVHAIKECRVMVLIFSSNANASPQVPREVELAMKFGKPVVPFRIQDVHPEANLEYHLNTVHWLDALTPPLETHIGRLIEVVKAIIATTPRPAPPYSDSPDAIDALHPSELPDPQANSSGAHSATGHSEPEQQRTSAPITTAASGIASTVRSRPFAIAAGLMVVIAIAAAFLLGRRGADRELMGLLEQMGDTPPSVSGSATADSRTIFARADSLHDRGRFDEAVEAQEAGIKALQNELGKEVRDSAAAMRTIAVALNNLGWYNLLARDGSQAHRVLDVALKYEPENLIAKLNHGHSLVLIDKLEEAEDEYKSVVRASKTNRERDWLRVLMDDLITLRDENVFNASDSALVARWVREELNRGG